ncbi:GTPase HflX [Litorivicinus lipolyticus]|uniref:GTPase HflX n=1 Tax=Litorivicinus lipolyticus TaxID=418701 RepID=A0A5Q2QA18_9GAMM|nr:ribosome rescue GTPase HflX [Litorivicinus lipolyticus]QGG81168.1 GTPase HflX [Litorivicinus lipolyticus]
MFFERETGGERVLGIQIVNPRRDAQDDYNEFKELMLSSGGELLEIVSLRRDMPRPSTYLGKGQVEELADKVADMEVDLVIFDRSLSPTQEKNLEAALMARVLDRTGLILDIFASRAATHEGKLQVELAQLEFVRTRLIRGWTHLERQKGGIGLRGPGETQLETDRRLLNVRVDTIKKRLEKVRASRAQGRRARERSETPTVALVGYTNAGKSTLFNQVTRGTVYAADQLFATLDPTLRQLDMGGGGHAVIADTVGFIRDLPHSLVQAFHATLEEAALADLLLVVEDCADPERDDRRYHVDQVLGEIGAADIPTLRVYNKADLHADATLGRVDRDDQGVAHTVWVSALTGGGLDVLRTVIGERVDAGVARHRLLVPASGARARAALHDAGGVLNESYSDAGEYQLDIELADKQWQRLRREHELDQWCVD